MKEDFDGTGIWELRRDSELLATIEVLDQDFPWKYGSFAPGEAFDSVRHYFSVQPDRETARAVREQLREQKISLTPQGGVSSVREFTLIVEGDEARFRFL